MTTLENANPLVFQRSKERTILPEEEDDNIVDKIDGREVFGESEVQGACSAPLLGQPRRLQTYSIFPLCWLGRARTVERLWPFETYERMHALVPSVKMSFKLDVDSGPRLIKI